MSPTIQNDFDNQRDLGGSNHEIGANASSRTDTFDFTKALARVDSRRRFTGRTATAPSLPEGARDHFESGSIEAAASTVADARKLFETGSAKKFSHVGDAKKRFESRADQTDNSSDTASKSFGFPNKGSQRHQANSKQSSSSTSTVSIDLSASARPGIDEQSGSNTITAGANQSELEKNDGNDDNPESSSEYTNTARSIFGTKINAKIPDDLNKISNLEKNNEIDDKTESNTEDINNVRNMFGPKIRVKVPGDSNKMSNLEKNKDIDEKTESSTENINNARNMFGPKIRTKIPSDSSKMTYRQRLEQIKRIKESIERAKHGKVTTTPKSTDDEDGDMDEDAAALFYNARRSPTVEENISAALSFDRKTAKIDDERFDLPNFANASVTQGSEKNNNFVSPDHSADKPSLPNNQKKIGDSSSKLSSDHCVGDSKSTTNTVLRMVTDEIPIDKNAAEDFFAGLEKARVSALSKSKLEKSERKQAAPTTKSTDGSTEHTAELFDSLDSFDGSSSSDTDTDSDSNDSSTSLARKMAKSPKENTTNTQKAAKIAAANEFFAALAAATSSGNDDISDSDSDSDSSDTSSYQPYKLKKDEKNSNNGMFDNVDQFFVDQGTENDGESCDSDSESDGSPKPFEAVSTNEENARIDGRSDSDSDDSSESSESIENKRPKSSICKSADSDPDSNYNSNQSEVLTTIRQNSDTEIIDEYSSSDSDSDNSTKPSQTITKNGNVDRKFNSDSVDSSKLSSAIATKEIKNDMSGVHSNSNPESDDISRSYEDITRKEQEAKCDGNNDSDSEATDISKASEAVEVQNAKIKNNGMSVSYSDSDLDSNHSSNASEAILRKKLDDAGSYDSDSDHGYSLKQTAGEKAKNGKTENDVTPDVYSDSGSSSDDSSKSSESIIFKEHEVRGDESYEKNSDSHNSSNQSTVAEVKVSRAENGTIPDAFSGSDSDSDDSSNSSESKTQKGPKARQFYELYGDTPVNEFMIQNDAVFESDSHSNGDGKFSGNEMRIKMSTRDKNILEAGVASSFVQVEDRKNGDDCNPDSNFGPVESFAKESTDELSRNYKHDDVEFLSDLTKARNNNAKEQSDAEVESEHSNSSNRWRENITNEQSDADLESERSDTSNRLWEKETPKTTEHSSINYFEEVVTVGNLNRVGDDSGHESNLDDETDEDDSESESNLDDETDEDDSENESNLDDETDDETDDGTDRAEIPGNEKSDSNSNKEARILLLHEEMKEMGLSPTIIVNKDDVTCRSMNTAFSKDSYLEDLLTQREERQSERREEAMEEAMEVYNSVGEPKADGLFLAILEKITKKQHEAFAEKDRIHDTLISKELVIRGHDTKMNHSFDDEPKSHVQNNTKKHPEAIQSRFDEGQQQDEKPRSQRKKKKKRRGEFTPLIKHETSDRSGLKSIREENPDSRNLKRSDVDIEYALKHKATLPLIAESDTIPEESSSSHLSPEPLPCDEDQISVNGFEAEYYYDEERAMLDRKAIRLLEKEAELSRQEFKLTRKMMLAATGMCCLAFVLILIFILDPLDRGSLTKKP